VTVCKYFRKGTCKFGDKCALSHVLEGSSNEQAKQEKLQEMPSTSEKAIDIPGKTSEYPSRNAPSPFDTDYTKFGSLNKDEDPRLEHPLHRQLEEPAEVTDLYSADTNTQYQIMNETLYLPSSLKSALISDDEDEFDLNPYYQKNTRDSSYRDVTTSNLTAEEIETARKAIAALNAPKPKEKILCPFHITGKCKFGTSCKQIHGEQCPICLKNQMNPFNEEESKKHLEECQAKQKRIKEERGLECGICYELIESKKDSRYGLLNCNHSFCLNVIIIIVFNLVHTSMAQ
jgi:hypothetical protein